MQYVFVLNFFLILLLKSNLISTELNIFHKKLEKEKYISSLDKLEEYAKNAWNSLLGYMIGNIYLYKPFKIIFIIGMETKNIPPNNIIEILIKTNLMKLYFFL